MRKTLSDLSGVHCINCVIKCLGLGLFIWQTINYYCFALTGHEGLNAGLIIERSVSWNKKNLIHPLHNSCCSITTTRDLSIASVAIIKKKQKLKKHFILSGKPLTSLKLNSCTLPTRSSSYRLSHGGVIWLRLRKKKSWPPGNLRLFSTFTFYVLLPGTIKKLTFANKENGLVAVRSDPLPLMVYCSFATNGSAMGRIATPASLFIYDYLLQSGKPLTISSCFGFIANF